jgi:NAD(P)-dependent dehydrogenase (short-subunit alcohol dehydrogenase family)
VYAAARDPRTVAGPGVVPIELDVTDHDQVRDVARQCGDVDLLVNNSGVSRTSPLLAAPTMAGAREEMEVNYFGMLAMCRAFAPVLGRNGGGALVNVLSLASWLAIPSIGSYSASKAAAWTLTNGVRVELRHQGTLVVGVHAGFIDTDMAASITQPKIDAADVARQTFDAVEAGHEEVLTDEWTRETKAALSHDLELIYPGVQRAWDEAHPRPE